VHGLHVQSGATHVPLLQEGCVLFVLQERILERQGHVLVLPHTHTLSHTNAPLIVWCPPLADDSIFFSGVSLLLGAYGTNSYWVPTAQTSKMNRFLFFSFYRSSNDTNRLGAYGTNT